MVKQVTNKATGEKAISQPRSMAPVRQADKRGNRRARSPLSGVPIDVELAKQALIHNKGVIAKAADSLGVDRNSLSKCIKRNPDLKLIHEQERERLIDLVEDRYIQEAIAGSEKHGAFILKTLGRHRGYDIAWKESQFNILSQALSFINTRESTPPTE